MGCLVGEMRSPDLQWGLFTMPRLHLWYFLFCGGDTALLSVLCGVTGSVSSCVLSVQGGSFLSHLWFSIGADA